MAQFIVDPETPLPEVDHEWAIMQSEWYVSEPDSSGLAEYDADALFNEEPLFVTFNGRTDALVGDNTLKMNVGERGRIYFVNEGLNLDSNFHPIGSHWDLVYPEEATHSANRVIRGLQSTLVVAGAGQSLRSTLLCLRRSSSSTMHWCAPSTRVRSEPLTSGDANAEIFGTADAAPPSEGEGEGEGESVAVHGEELFAATCAACHGADATGVAGLGPSLVGNTFVAGLSDEDLLAFLNVGRPAGDLDNTTGIAMPAKGGNPSLSDGDLNDLIEYLRGLE